MKMRVTNEKWFDDEEIEFMYLLDRETPKNGSHVMALVQSLQKEQKIWSEDMVRSDLQRARSLAVAMKAERQNSDMEALREVSAKRVELRQKRKTERKSSSLWMRLKSFFKRGSIQKEG